MEKKKKKKETYKFQNKRLSFPSLKWKENERNKLKYTINTLV